MDELTFEFHSGMTDENWNRAMAKLEKFGFATRATELIRCKDCKYYNAGERLCNDLMGFGRYWEPNDFCSNAERRTDG